MGRTKGSFIFTNNFEVQRAAPLDARQKVGYYADLVDPSAWISSDGYVWLYDGAIVVVTNDPSSGVYWLKDAGNYTNYTNWERIGTGMADVSIGVINIGDGSAGVFSGYDSSGNIELRTFKGSSGTTVTQVGDQIVIGIDASYSGQANYGENVGIGDASLYVQNVGDALQFRELQSASSDLTINVSDNLIIFDGSFGGSGTGVDGGVWISDINPQTPAGNVGNKVTSSNGYVLNSCITDTELLTVTVMAIPGHTLYEPSVAVNGVSVLSFTRNNPGPQWSGDVDITWDGISPITAVHAEGATWSTIISQDIPAVITAATFVGGYPSGQSELKENDTMNVSVLTDVSIDRIEFSGSSYAPVPETFNASGTSNVVNVDISDQGNTTQDLGFRIRVRKPTGTWSDYFLSTSMGTVDGVNTVKLNNTYPVVSVGSITYPATQGALKNTETATVANTVTSTGTITYAYSSPNGDLTVSNPTAYETSKTVTRAGGTYNISTTNFTLTATRTENNAQSSGSTVVYIANAAPTLTVVNGASRFRSGGNDGTSAQNHTITINSDQRLGAAPTLSYGGGGTWQGGGFSWTSTATSFTRSLQVHDDDAKGTYSWGAISGTGLSGLVQTTNSGALQYILGGFVARDISVAAFGTTATFNTEASDYSKISSTLNWTVKTLTDKQAVGTTTGSANQWAINALDTNPGTINILDAVAAQSSSQASTIIGFEETV